MKKILSLFLTFCLTFSMLCIPVITADAKVAPGSIEKAVQWAIDTANDDSHGYSQANRWGNPDYDCASFVISAYRSVGFKLKSAVHCGNMKQAFIDEGFVWIPNTEIDLSTSKYLKRGDILLNTRSHTEIYIGDNMQVGAHDGTYDIYDYNDPGDSTGLEICPVKYTNGSRWEGILRYQDEPLNLGDSFYCNIINNETGKAVTNDSDENCENRNATIRTLTNEPNQVWKFERHEDGSYKIISCFNSLVLDVTGAGTTAGTNVGVYFDNSKPAQRWMIYGSENSYTLNPMCNDLALDISSGNTDGTNVRMGTDNGSKTQRFTLKMMPKPQQTYVECMPGTSSTPTTLWWNFTLDTKYYDVKIYKNAVSVSEPFMVVENVLDTYCLVDLPAGNYEALVITKNDYEQNISLNTVKFFVDSDTPRELGDVDLDGEISIMDATQIQLFLVHYIPLSPNQQTLADTDKDTSLSVIDATTIQRLLAKIITEF